MSIAATQLGNELAFPCLPPIGPDGAMASGYPFPEMGLRKRELFAAMALQGLCAAITHYDGPSRVIDMEGIAQDAAQLADCLLKELTK